MKFLSNRPGQPGGGGAIEALFRRRSGVQSEDSDDRSRGFYESSFDLRAGLDVVERPLAELPEDLKHQFRRPRAG